MLNGRGIITGEYYHVFNRGNDGQLLFHERRDYARFLFLILYSQFPITFHQISRNVTHYIKKGTFNIKSNKINSLKELRYVDFVGFTLMPNHFHLLLKERQEGGIAKCLQRIQNAYTKYFNKKYDKKGHLFQGPYKSVYIENNAQLIYVSAYIHLNQKEISEWANNAFLYPWSSFTDYCNENRWENILETDVIMAQFSSGKEYFEYVYKSGAKQTL